MIPGIDALEIVPAILTANAMATILVANNNNPAASSTAGITLNFVNNANIKTKPPTNNITFPIDLSARSTGFFVIDNILNTATNASNTVERAAELASAFSAFNCPSKKIAPAKSAISPAIAPRSINVLGTCFIPLFILLVEINKSFTKDNANFKANAAINILPAFNFDATYIKAVIAATTNVNPMNNPIIFLGFAFPVAFTIAVNELNIAIIPRQPFNT